MSKKKSTFRDKVCEYLGKEYKSILQKEIKLPIPDGIYKYRGEFLWKDHILPIELRREDYKKWQEKSKNDSEAICKYENIREFIRSPQGLLKFDSKYLNLLPEFRNELIKYIESQPIKLHHLFHHLSSSQAMCMNFFYPLYEEQKLDLVLKFLSKQCKNKDDSFNKEKVDYSTVKFEKTGNETNYDEAATPTQFDFYFETNNGKKFYFEIKYTEDTFGSAPTDKKHKDKFKDIYKPMMEKAGIKGVNEQTFLKNYQILRNLSHINKSSYVVFVCPE